MTPCRQPTETDPATGQTAFAQDFGHNREATADSDIDLLVVLDQVTIDDLDAFHAAMRSLPDGERAVGFTCGRAELAAWPAYELYQFEHGTEVWLGDLHPLLPEYDEDDIRLGARVSVANLYHMVNHTYLTTCDIDETARTDVLKSLLKGVLLLPADRPRRPNRNLRSHQAAAAHGTHR